LRDSLLGMIRPTAKPDGPTRGQVLALLRRGPKTVEELALAIGITDNAVRLHLTALERDGMARTAGVRREGSVGKPATLYAVTQEAESAFSKAYEPVLTTLLVTLAAKLGENEISALLRDVGRQLAANVAAPDDSLEQRVRAAASVLDALGADTEVEAGSAGGFVVRGFACPLSRSVAQCPPLCGAVEELVAGITKAKVQERCDRSSTPRCTFLVSPRVRKRQSPAGRE
jgi:predicted ArsR family transcriptional regulator